MKIKNVRGFTLIELIVVLAILSGIAMTVGPQIVQQKIPMEQVGEANSDIAEIKAAANAYFMENRAWPTTVNELITTGYYPGTGVSPFGNPYVIAPNGNNLQISVDAGRDQLANMLAGEVPFGSIAGQTVTTEMGTPTREAIQSYFLARRAVPGCPDCNQLSSGTNIDANNNDLNNIGSLDAVNATITNATITNATANTLDVDRIDFGSNSITYAGNNLNVNASQVNINGQLSLNGDVVANNNNITGINQLSATNGTITNLTSTTGSIDTLSGNNLSYNSGTINSLTGNSLNYTTGAITNLTGNTLSYGSGTINNLSGNSLTYGTVNGTNINGSNGNFTNLSTQGLTASSATINNLTVNGVSNLNQVNANRADITAGYFNTVSADTVSGTTGNFTNLSATNANIGSGVVINASGDTVTSTGNASFNTLNSTNVSANTVNGGDVTATSGSVSGNANVNNLSASNLTVSNKLQTANITSNTSSLGSASATSFVVSGGVSVQGVNVYTANITTANINTVTGTNANYNTVTANAFSGGAFTSNDDFYTAVSSVNNNYLLIDEQKNKLDNCMYVSKYCIPKAPVISNVSCPTCSDNAPVTNFSATISAKISECQRGCNYSWSYNSVSGSCVAGTISKGSTKTVLCNISATLAPQEGLTDVVTLTATNSKNSSYSTSVNVNVDWFNSDVAFNLSALVSSSCRNSKGQSSCSDSKDTTSSSQFVNVAVFPLIQGQKFTNWSSTDCPTCTWDYVVIGNSCTDLTGGNGVSNATISDALNDVLGKYTTAAYSEGLCNVSFQITVRGRGDTYSFVKTIRLGWFGP